MAKKLKKRSRDKALSRGVAFAEDLERKLRALRVLRDDSNDDQEAVAAAENELDVNLSERDWKADRKQLIKQLERELQDLYERSVS